MTIGWGWKAAVAAGVLWASSAGALQAGQSAAQPGRTAPGMPTMEPDRRDPAVARLEEQAAKNRNDERQKRIVADTAKLYELASQLKEDVAKTDKNTLSLDVVKKADEIEKLAHTVKDRMRG